MRELSATTTTNIYNKIKFVIWYDDNLQERTYKEEVTFLNSFLTETILK